MRGVHDTGVVFMIPTYLFTGTLLIVIAVGAWHVLQQRASASGDAAARDAARPTAAVSWWLLLKVFSSGCTAMTGVEAVSNGVMAFRDDTRKNAKITLTIIIVAAGDSAGRHRVAVPRLRHRRHRSRRPAATRACSPC